MCSPLDTPRETYIRDILHGLFSEKNWRKLFFQQWHLKAFPKERVGNIKTGKKIFFKSQSRRRIHYDDPNKIGISIYPSQHSGQICTEANKVCIQEDPYLNKTELPIIAEDNNPATLPNEKWKSVLTLCASGGAIAPPGRNFFMRFGQSE